MAQAFQGPCQQSNTIGNTVQEHFQELYLIIQMQIRASLLMLFTIPFIQTWSLGSLHNCASNKPISLVIP